MYIFRNPLLFGVDTSFSFHRNEQYKGVKEKKTSPIAFMYSSRTRTHSHPFCFAIPIVANISWQINKNA